MALPGAEIRFQHLLSVLEVVGKNPFLRVFFSSHDCDPFHRELMLRAVEN